MTPTSLVPGTVIGRDDSRLAAEVEGLLEYVAEVGDEVRAGDEVARIEDTVFQIALSEAKASLEPIEARLGYYDSETERLERLTHDNNVARSQYEQIRSNRGEQAGLLATARLRVRLAADRLARTRITAPFAGVVTERFLTRGERVEGGQQILRMVDTANLEVQVRIPLDMTAHTEIGTEVVVKAGEETALTKVRARVPVGDDRSRLFELRLALNPDSRWLAGQAVRVAIPVSEKRLAIAVPRDALVIRQQGTSVFKIGANGQAEAVAVQVGVAEGSMVEVIGGIAPGDRVVIRGNERLQPGQQVQERLL